MPVLVRFTALRSNSRLKGLINGEIREELKFYTKDYIDNIIDQATQYPPVPGPPNTYVRTGRYGTYMLDKNVGDGDRIAYTIQNAVQDRWGRYYAGYVGGSSQTSFHAAHGWKKVSELAHQSEFQAGAQAVIMANI